MIIKSYEIPTNEARARLSKSLRDGLGEGNKSFSYLGQGTNLRSHEQYFFYDERSVVTSIIDPCDGPMIMKLFGNQEEGVRTTREMLEQIAGEKLKPMGE